MGLPRISDAEWEIMNVLWSESPLTAQSVAERVAAQRWSERTVKTMLNRLVAKRALGHTPDGRRYSYHPLVRREACVRAETRSFAARVFAGATGAMLVHLLRDEQLTDEDLAVLRQTLERKAGTR